jgi:hypothetical protein
MSIRVDLQRGDAVDRLRASGGFVYRPDAFATRFEETADGVRVWTRNAANAVDEVRGDRLFVAAGVLPERAPRSSIRSTSRIARSRCATAATSSCRCCNAGPADPDPATEPRHTLAQVFVEIVDPRVSAHTIHVQMYTYHDGFASTCASASADSRRHSIPSLED